MIHNIIAIFVILISIETAVLWAESHPRTKHLFKYMPAVFWIYFLPMVISSLGFIDNQSPLYGWAISYGLPASLFLLLLGVDLKAISRLGRTALLMFLAGSLGMMIGVTVSFGLFRPVIGNEFWSGFGTLCGSWTGGSANMIAVKEAISTPDDIFLPMVVVDTIVPYLWMGVLVFASTWQGAIDTYNKADRSVLDNIKHRLGSVKKHGPAIITLKNILLITVLASGAGGIFQYVSKYLPVIKGVVSSFTWVIILASVSGLACSLTRLRGLEEKGSTKIGYFILYFVLTTIGAKASLSHLQASGILILAGFVVVFIHAAVLMAVARFLRAPIMLAATASQANIGGVASAPIVAEIYQPGLSAIGLLMAILGNIIGTYLGILAGQMCRWITLI